MDKSVAQKFMIVMSMLTAIFATVFVCGSIVGSSVSADSFIQPVPKVQHPVTVTYSDTSIYETPDEIVSHSDIDIAETQNVTPVTTTTDPSYVVENGVTVVEFIDDDEDYTSETIDIPEEDIDNQFLFMTTVTTKLPDATVREDYTTNTTLKQTTASTTRKTTKKTVAVTSAKPFTSKSTTKPTTKATTKKKTTSSTTSTTVKPSTATEKSSVVSITTTTATTTTTTSTTTTTTTTSTTTTTKKITTKSTTVSSATSATTTAAPKTTTTTVSTTTAASTTTTSKAPQIGGAVSINKRTTTETNDEAGQP